jgi:hypothetical protein
VGSELGGQAGERGVVAATQGDLDVGAQALVD